MEQNPYESPKERNASAVRGGLAIGTLLILSIPAGCICGGITCYSTGAAGSMAGEHFGNPIWRTIAASAAIPLGLAVVGLIPILAIKFFARRQTGSEQ